MQFLETVLYFVITLGVLVFVHEFGHFIAAKLCRMRVDRFSIGFPPRAVGKQIGETDYCISWIPIGGYVKIAGMIDESFDTEHIDQPPQPWEFRSKPIWQRMIVISAGVIMNIILAIGIFWAIDYFQGRSVRQTTDIVYVEEGSPAARAGLLAGDKIVEINGKQISNWDQILTSIYVETAGEDLHISLLRQSTRVEATLPRSSIPDPAQVALGIVPAGTEDSCIVNTVQTGMPADKAGLKPRDVLLSLNGVRVRFDQNVREIVRAHAGKPLLVEWRRGDTTLSGTVTPSGDGKIGISFGVRYKGPITTIRYSISQSFTQGLKDIVNISGLFAQQLWQLVTGKVSFSQSVGGPIMIAKQADQAAEMGFFPFLSFMALLSISLAVLNILPFPALDGGHLVFLVYEGVFQREIPVKVKIGLQKAGIALLLAFMAFVLYNDIAHF